MLGNESPSRELQGGECSVHEQLGSVPIDALAGFTVDRIQGASGGSKVENVESVTRIWSESHRNVQRATEEIQIAIDCAVIIQSATLDHDRAIGGAQRRRQRAIDCHLSVA